MFRQLFEEGLELQKIKLREQRAHAKMQRLEHQRQHQDQITSMENYYKDQVGHAVTHTCEAFLLSPTISSYMLSVFQFSLLAEKLAQERQEIQVRKKAQEKVICQSSVATTRSYQICITRKKLLKYKPIKILCSPG